MAAHKTRTDGGGAEEENCADTDHQVPKVPGLISCRHLLVFLAFLGFVNVYALRVNLSVALVAMVNTTDSQDDVANSTDPDACPGDSMNHTNTMKPGEFNWDSNTQGLILGSFFYGYIVTQLPGGWLAEQFGGKKMFGFGVLCTAVFTLLTPLAARTSLGLLIAVRVLEGLGEGVTFPAMHAMLGVWAPRLERSKLTAFAYAGAQFGTVLSMPLSGLLAVHGPFGGWPSVFYVFGSLGIVWFIVWMILVHDKPSMHPRISAAERNYIEKSIGHSDKKKMATPWLAIFSSPRVWAIIVAHFCFNWLFYTLLTTLPLYMKQVLKFDLSQNGFLSAVPYLCQWITINLCGLLADHLRFKGYLSTTAVRKIWTCLGLGLPAVFLVSTGFIKCDNTLAVVMICLSLGTAGFAMSGFNCNHLDIGPQFAGTLMGITNCAATIPGFASPQVVGLITSQGKTRAQWQIIFYISAAIIVFGSLFYLVFGTGVEQEWAKEPEDEETEALTQEGENGSIQTDYGTAPQ